MISIFKEIAAVFSPPPADPKRFAPKSAPPNWFGELEGHGRRKQRGINERVVLVNEDTGEFEFPESNPFEGANIHPALSEKDIAGLRRHQLNPDNPVYAAAKKYFAANPMCSKKDLAAHSGGGGHRPMSVETAKDVIAVFRENAFATLSKPSPTVEWG